MTEPIRNWLSSNNKGISSQDSLAKAILAQHPDLTESLKYRSLSAKISSLDKRAKAGRTWWRNRPDLLDTLSAITGTPVEDFSLDTDRIPSQHSWQHFPGLRPFDGGAELPAELLRTDDAPEGVDVAALLSPWLNRARPEVLDRHAFEEITWLSFPKGFGLNLYWEVVLQRSVVKAIHVTALSDIQKVASNDVPLVIRVDEWQSDCDFQVLARKSPGTRWLVLCDFPLPGTTREALPSWEARTLDPIGSRVHNAAHRSMASSISYRTLKPCRDWHDRLISWIESRLSQAQASRTILNSARNWVATLAPFLPISCADIYKLACHSASSAGEGSLPKLEGAALRRLAQQSLGMSRADVDALTTLAFQHFCDLDSPWLAPTTSETWAAYSKEPLTGDLIRAARHVTNTRSATEANRRARDLLNTLVLTVTPPIVDSSLLKRGNDGLVKVALPLYASALVVSRLASQLSSGFGSVSWTDACFDESRRPLIDAALSCLELPRLFDIVEHLLRQSRDDLNLIGFKEALYIEAGTRLAREFIDPEAVPDFLIELCHEVLKSARSDADFGPNFFSRCTAQTQSSPEYTRLVIAHWGWSAVSAAKPRKLPSGWQWCFPLWSNHFHNGPIQNLFGVALQESHLAAQSIGRLVEDAALNLVVRMTAPPPVEPLECLLPELIAQGANGDWDIRPTWWRSMATLNDASSRSLAATLASRLRVKINLPESAQEAAERLLDSMIDFGHIEGLSLKIYLLLQTEPGIWMLSNLSAEQLFERRHEPLVASLWSPGGVFLPPETRRSLLMLIQESEPRDERMANALIQSISDPSELLNLLRAGIFSTWAASALWHDWPDVAQREMQDGEKQSQRILLEYAPISHSKHVISIICRQNELHEWRRDDLTMIIRRHLPYSGNQAAIAIAVLSRISARRNTGKSKATR